MYLVLKSHLVLVAASRFHIFSMCFRDASQMFPRRLPEAYKMHTTSQMFVRGVENDVVCWCLCWRRFHIRAIERCDTSVLGPCSHYCNSAKHHIWYTLSRTFQATSIRLLVEGASIELCFTNVDKRHPVILDQAIDLFLHRAVDSLHSDGQAVSETCRAQEEVAG